MSGKVGASWGIWGIGLSSFQGEEVEKFMENHHFCVAPVFVGLQPSIWEWAWATVRASSWEGELNVKQGRAGIIWNPPAPLPLSATTSNHDDLQRVMAAHSLYLPKLAYILCVALGPLGSRSQNGTSYARDFLRETSVKENGERTGIAGRLNEPSDHGAGLILGEGEREERKIGWINAALREFSKASGESSSQSRPSEECPISWV